MTNNRVYPINWELRRSVRLYLWWRRVLCKLDFHCYPKLTNSAWDRFIRCLACGKWRYADHSDAGIDFDGKENNLVLPYPAWYEQAYYSHTDKPKPDSFSLSNWRYQ